MYSEIATAVTFLTPTVFRAAIPLPADVPTGNYAIDVKLFADGAMIARTTSALEVIKAGFEQYVADAARDHGLLYGLATTLMALLTGWSPAWCSGGINPAGSAWRRRHRAGPRPACAR